MAIPNPTYENTILINLYGNTAWYICEGIHLGCIVLDLYLLYALLHYRAIKLARQKDAGRHSRKGGNWLEKLCLIGIIAALGRYANNQALLYTGWTSSSRCSILLNVSIALYFITIHPVYLFLWVRQRIFYANRALKHLYSKTVRTLSWVALVCFVFTTILIMILFAADQENSASGRVCRYNYSQNGSAWDQVTFIDETRHQGVKVNTMAGLIGGAIQVSFLALFLYPIMDNKLRTMRARHMRSGNAIFNVIRRSFLLGGLCILTDVAIGLLVKPIHRQFPEAIFAPLAMYDVNLIINLLCIISTFRDFKAMLFPWYYFCRSKKNPSLKSRSFRVSVRKQSIQGNTQFSERKHEHRPTKEFAQNKISDGAQDYDKMLQRKRSFIQDADSQRFVNQEFVVVSVDDDSRKYRLETAKTGCLEAEKTQEMVSEDNYYSDTVLHCPKHQSYPQKRSASLNLISNISMPVLRRAKSHVILSIINISKSWLLDRKPF